MPKPAQVSAASGPEDAAAGENEETGVAAGKNESDAAAGEDESDAATAKNEDTDTNGSFNSDYDLEEGFAGPAADPGGTGENIGSD